MIAFFPGKFQPPHLGHVMTLVSIYSEFDQIIVGVTEDIPLVLEQRERVEIFRFLFQFMKKIKVLPIKGTLIHYTSLEGLPEFDVCLTGNPDVIATMSSLGKVCRDIPRSQGIGYSGTEIRKLLEK